MASPQPRIGVVVYPGSNDDHDALWALAALDAEAVPVWHDERELPDLDAVVVPGGFSYGDYLRCGAIARFSPATAAVCEFAAAGGLVLGICNGFQILCEAGLLPGALVRNESLRFVCRDVRLTVERDDLPFTGRCSAGQQLVLPVKHGDGRHRPARAAARPGIGEADEPLAFRRLEQLHLRREPLGPRLLRDGQLLHEIRRSPRCRRPCHDEEASGEGVTGSSRLPVGGWELSRASRRRGRG